MSPEPTAGDRRPTDPGRSRRDAARELDLDQVVRQALSTVPHSDPEVAREAGLLRSRLSRIRRGQARIRPEEVEALAGAVARMEGGALAERALRMALEMRADREG